METPEEFEIRKTAFIREKKKLVDEFIHLSKQQDDILAKIRALRRPVFGPPEIRKYPYSEDYERVRKILYEGEKGECDFYLDKRKRKYGEIKGKPEIRQTKSIEDGWMDIAMEIREEEQSYLHNRLADPSYRTECEKKGSSPLEKRDSW